jgi:hypothetical protein
VFQLDCHPAPNLIITLRRMVKFLTAHFPILRTAHSRRSLPQTSMGSSHSTIASYVTAQVISIVLLPVDVAVFAPLSCHPSVGSPPPPTIAPSYPSPSDCSIHLLLLLLLFQNENEEPEHM